MWLTYRFKWVFSSYVFLPKLIDIKKKKYEVEHVVQNNRNIGILESPSNEYENVINVPTYHWHHATIETLETTRIMDSLNALHRTTCLAAFGINEVCMSPRVGVDMMCLVL